MSAQNPLISRLENVMDRILNELEAMPIRTMLKFIVLLLITAWAIKVVKGALR